MPSGFYKRTKKHRLAHLKRICKRGHNTFICGRTKRCCNKCKILLNKKYKKGKKKYYKSNKKKILIKMKKYRDEHKEKAREYQKIYRKKHQKELKNKRKKYNRKHRKELLVKILKKKKENICFKLRCKLRERINSAIRRGTKAGSAVGNLGCSIEFLKQYIEKKFYGGMTWNSWGAYWHLDHKIALWKFDLTDPIQFQQAVHYTNLQPLTIKDHQKKTSKEATERYEKLT